MYKNIRILFPNEPFDRRMVDSIYENEFNSYKLMNIKTYFYDYDELVDNNKFISNISEDDKGVLIYRGWMLKPEQYEFLYNKILEKTNGYLILINSPEQYRNCHCFPYVYNDIKEYTPRIIVLNDWDKIESRFAVAANISFDNFFLKDYVKSIKTEKGIEKLSSKINLIELSHNILKFVEERGKLFTGGIVIKEFVNLKKVNGYTNEWRSFFLYGKLVEISNNSEVDISNGNKPPDDLVDKVGKILSEKSNFFTVDFDLTEDDKWIVIETGDGGVSGLYPNYNELIFCNKLINSYENIF